MIHQLHYVKCIEIYAFIDFLSNRSEMPQLLGHMCTI